MSMDDESTERWLLGSILTALLGGGLVVAVLFSIVLTPLSPYFALGSGGGGGVCSAAAVGSGHQPTDAASLHNHSAVSLAHSLAARVSTASLSLRDLCNANGKQLLRLSIRGAC